MIEANAREAVDVHTLAEEQAVGRAAEVEHAELLALPDALALLHRDLARAHLVHADGDEGHETDGGVVGLDEEDGARGERGEVALRRAEAGGVDLVEPRVRGRREQRLAEVRALAHVGAHHAPADGRVPPVVGERGQEGLVHGRVVELRGERVVGEHCSRWASVA